MNRRPWSVAQLGKWRIRKAEPGERPPWAEQRAIYLAENRLPDDPADYALPRWWVWPPGKLAPAFCCETHTAAVAAVIDAEMREAMRRMEERAAAESSSPLPDVRLT